MQEFGLMMIKKNDNQKGFTLIEVVLAILILTIGILGTMVMQDASIKGINTRETVQYTRIAQV